FGVNFLFDPLDGAARDEDSRGFIREVRMGPEYRSGVTLPGCAGALHISRPLTLASAEISFEARFARVLLTRLGGRVCACARRTRKLASLLDFNCSIVVEAGGAEH